MPGWGVIPSIRVRDVAKALAFYTVCSSSRLIAVVKPLPTLP